ncbi:MAG: AmmeMemoRadiSam system protein B [Lentisphaeria bacterium]|nr:AmmeMemoRadiSam system protein B [Lentisphaeria bacterium]
MDTNVRAAAVAGTFYGAEPGMLRYQLNQIRIPDPVKGIHGCMIPHAGYVFSMPTALRTLAAARENRYSRAVIIGPSHRYAFNGICLADYKSWATPFGNMEVDEEGAEYLKSSVSETVHIDNTPHIQEHSIEVELPLLHYFFGKIKILPVLAGQLNCNIADALGAVMSKLDTPDTLWIISGDFTHYGKSFGYTPFGVPVEQAKLNALDREAAEHIAKCDFAGLTEFINRTQATICGVNPAALYLKTIANSGTAVEGNVTAVTDSGKVSRDLSHVVGYAGITFRKINK